MKDREDVPVRSRHGSGLMAGLQLRWLDVAILGTVFVFDTFVFSKLLRVDELSAIARIGIVSYSALGVCLLLFRRRWPVLVFCALLVHSIVAHAFTDGYYPVLLLLVALEAVAELRSIKVSLSALAVTFVPTAIMIAGAANAARPEAVWSAAVGSAVFYTLISLLAWGIGRWARRHRTQVDTLQEQHIEQVAEQRELAETAVSEERLRIARELHDIVAHSVTIMVLHAAGAKRVVDTDLTRAKASLSTIESSGKQAMGELRRLLELLREGGVQPGTGAPLPGIDQLPNIIESIGASGVAVTLETTGRPRRLDASIDLAAFRLVQEGLTNVTKHGGPGARATITIDWGDEKVTVAVEDDGMGSSGLSPSLSTGNGLAGLRERISIAGGDFVAGPTEGGGFRLAARLPLSAVEPAPQESNTAGPEIPHQVQRQQPAADANGSGAHRTDAADHSQRADR